MTERPLDTVAAYGTTVEIDRRRNRVVLEAPDGSRTTYPFIPTGTLVTLEERRLAREGLTDELQRQFDEHDPSFRTGFVVRADVIAPGVATVTTENQGLSSTSRTCWTIGAPTEHGTTATAED